MFGERWQSILSEHANNVALNSDGKQWTFAELEAHALAHPTPEPIIVAKGTALDVMTAFIQSAHTGRPVQVVELDRDQRQATCPLPANTQVIKQTVGGGGVRRCQFFTAAQMLADADRLHRALRLDLCAVTIAAISPAHSYGLSVTVLQTLFHALPLHVVNEPFPELISQAIAQHDEIFLPGIPALWKAWLQARHTHWSKVALAVSAGSPLTSALEEKAFDEHRLKLHNLYGTSETGSVAYDSSDQPRGDATVLGKLLPGVKLTVADTAGAIVHSDSVGIGYDSVIAGELFTNASFRTTDHLSIDNGIVKFHRHLGAGINVAGRKLSPGEIAAKLERATGLRGIQVRGQTSRDPERCQEVVAVFPISSLALTPTFRAQACSQLSPWEMPRRWLGTDA